MVGIRKFRIIVLFSNRMEYWSNYSIQNFEYSHSTIDWLIYWPIRWLCREMGYLVSRCYHKPLPSLEMNLVHPTKSSYVSQTV